MTDIVKISCKLANGTSFAFPVFQRHHQTLKTLELVKIIVAEEIYLCISKTFVLRDFY